MILRILFYQILRKDLTNGSFFGILLLKYGDVMDNNLLIDRYRIIVDNICNKYEYDNNIKHLLYLIIPAFVKKYGYNRESLVINTFNNVKIFISDTKSDRVNAYYTSIPRNFAGKVVTDKLIVINNYDKISLVNLLDSLIHEFNHAINSYNNEVKFDDKKVYLRTGLTYSIYDRKDFKPIGKEDAFVLEEIINTRQTEEIINIIKSFNVDGSNNDTIFSINGETSDNYNSKAYYFEGYICKDLLTNKTFSSTMENLRISGSVDDIINWFDNIVGVNGSYNKLVGYLNKILNLEIEIGKGGLFKKMKVNKVRELSNMAMDIIREFNNNCNYN